MFSPRTITVLLIVSCLASAASAGDAEVARVRKEYPAALERLERAFAEVKAIGTLRSRHKEKSQVKRVTLAKEQQLRMASLKTLDGSGIGATGSERVECYAPSESFTVGRREAGGAYILMDIKRPGTPISAEIELDRNLLAPFSIFGKPMSKMMAEPSFRIVSVEPAGADKDRLKITYKYFDEINLVADGWVEVAPREGWVIRKSSNQFSKYPHVRIDCEIEYGPVGSGGFPLPTRVTYDQPGDRHLVFDFETITFEPTPEREFSPTFYGLPDLAGLAKDPSSSSAGAWLFGLAGLALVVAVGMKVLAGRIARRGAAN